MICLGPKSSKNAKKKFLLKKYLSNFQQTLCRCYGPLLLQPYFAQLNLLFQNKPKSFCLLFIVKQQFNMHSQKLFCSIPTQVFKNFLFQKDIIYLMYKAKKIMILSYLLFQKKFCKLIFSIMYVGSMHFCQGWVEPGFLGLALY